MTPAEIKDLVNRFRAAADDRKKIEELWTVTRHDHPTDTWVGDLCTRFKNTTDAAQVKAIADEVDPPEVPKPVVGQPSVGPAKTIQTPPFSSPSPPTPTPSSLPPKGPGTTPSH